MKRVVQLLICSLMISSVSSCKKTEAHDSLIGTWNIYDYSGEFYNQCEEEIEDLDDEATSLGTVVFDNTAFTMDYVLFQDDDECYDRSSLSNSGNWVEVDHKRKYLLFHGYELSLNGERWACNFSDDSRPAGKADYQDEISLGFMDSEGAQYWLRLKRE